MTRHSLRFSLALAATFLAVNAPSFAQQTAPPADINKAFEKDVDVQKYIERFESESREVYAQREAIVRAISLKPGMAVADIGAGTGLFTRLFAEQVGSEGTVYAVDISKEFLDHIAKQAKERGLTQVKTIRGTQTTTNLPPNSIDVAFFSDVYHHVEHPDQVLASIHRALKPGGRIVIVEFDRREGVSSEFVKNHIRASKDVFIKEIQDAGFQPIDTENPPKLKENFFQQFRKVRQAREGLLSDGPGTGLRTET